VLIFSRLGISWPTTAVSIANGPKSMARTKRFVVLTESISHGSDRTFWQLT